MLTRYAVLDISTAPIPDAAGYLEEPAAPAHYKDAEKIAAYVAEKKQEQAAKAALDLDLSRITALGVIIPDEGPEPVIYVCQTEDEERRAINDIADLVWKDLPVLVTFNGFRFDLPCLLRRARYLGASVPKITLDRYKTPHLDLYEQITHRGMVGGHSLGFYVRRLGWTDLHKPLTGAEEARVHETGQWAELAQSSRHDVLATYRLAVWLGLVAPISAIVEPHVESLL